VRFSAVTGINIKSIFVMKPPELETGMKRLLLGLSVVLLASVCAVTAFAQNTDEFENEFKAFKKKVETAKENPDAAPAGSPLGTAAAAADSNPLSGAAADNPLGPAANLPVSSQPPATSYAMSGQSPAGAPTGIEASVGAQRDKIDEQNFKNALKMLLPLTPEQIRSLLDSFKDSRQAAETPIAVPVPKVQVETVSLDLGEAPPVIKTSPIRVTTLTILDITGAPWPIQDVSWAGKFDVQGPPEEGGHVIRITPQTAHGMGNISIRLVDLNTPITFTLQSGFDEVYYRFDARIPKRGPLAKTPLIEHGGLKTVAGNDDNLVQVLDGTPPASSEKLKVDGVDGRTNAWRVSGHIYLRTPLTLLSPSWDSSVTSADGMNVYTLNDTPVVLLSDEGRMVRAHITADEVTP
jgi:intracellular multiplication protein IcmK